VSNVSNGASLSAQQMANLTHVREFSSLSVTLGGHVAGGGVVIV